MADILSKIMNIGSSKDNKCLNRLLILESITSSSVYASCAARHLRNLAFDRHEKGWIN